MLAGAGSGYVGKEVARMAGASDTVAETIGIVTAVAGATVTGYGMSKWQWSYEHGSTGIPDGVHNADYIEGAGSKVQFGSDTKSVQKLNNQMSQRGWTENSVRSTANSPYTTRTSTNMATGNPATVYYNQQGGYVIIDDVTNAVVQVSDNINPGAWIPDPNIINPYKP